MRTNNNIALERESEINELETTKFNINAVNIDYDHDDDNDENKELNIMNLDNKNKQKINNKLKLVLFFMCLLILLSLTLFTGAILEKVYGFIDPLDNDSFNNNNNNIMNEIHIRSEIMRELRGNRTNEEECEARRCCDIRDGLTIGDLPQGLDCKLLTDDECGDIDKYCEWDCDLPIIKLRKKAKFIRHFRRISGSPIPYQHFNDNNKDNHYNESDEIHDSYEECLAEASKVISSDDCGVEYEEQLDPKLVEALCRSHGDDNNIVYDGSGNGSYNLSANDSRDLGEDRNDDPRRLYVFNPDRRHRIQDWTFPHSAVMYLRFTEPDGTRGRCTGAMISNTWLLTAAHCIWSSGNFHTDFEVIKFVRDTAGTDRDIAANTYTVDRLSIIYPKFQQQYPQTWTYVNYDIGLLRLTANPGTSYFGIGHCDSWVGPRLFNDHQHPEDKGFELHQELDCTWQELHRRRFETFSCSFWSGSSGGPIWKEATAMGRVTRTIYGVWSADLWWSDFLVTNGATRIRRDGLALICAEIEPDQPGRCGASQLP